MALEDDIRILSGVSLFQGFTAQHFRLLAFGAETLKLPAGKDLYQVEAEADSAYVVAKGRIALYRERDGQRVIVDHAEPGALLSGLALIAEAKRLNSAHADLDTDLIRLKRKLFRRILEEYPHLALMLHARVLDQLQTLISRIEGLAPRFA